MGYNVIAIPSINLLPSVEIDFSPLRGILSSVSNLGLKQDATTEQLTGLTNQVQLNEVSLTDLQTQQADTAVHVQTIEIALTSVTASDGTIAQDEVILNMLRQQQDATSAQVESLGAQVSQAVSDISDLKSTTETLTNNSNDVASAIDLLSQNDMTLADNQQPLIDAINHNMQLLGDLTNALTATIEL